MRKQLARALFGGGVVVTALIAAMPAYAATTFTVTGGTSLTASLSTGTTVVLTDTRSHGQFKCTVASSVGTAKNGHGLSGSGIGAITSSTFGTSSKQCTGPLGSHGTATQKAGTKELLNAISYNSSTGVTTGSVSNVDTITTIISPLGTCTAVVVGTANSTYTNSTQILAFTNTGTLKVSSATGACAGLIATGDSVTFSSGSGGFKVKDTPGPLKITSP